MPVESVKSVLDSVYDPRTPEQFFFVRAAFLLAAETEFLSGSYAF